MSYSVGTPTSSPLPPPTTYRSAVPAKPKPKMGKKKSDIYSCFQILAIKNKANKSIFMCKFCDRQYLQNATKMESHIVTQCQKVPADVRTSYAKVGGGGGSRPTPPTRTTSPASDTSAPGDSRPQTPLNFSVGQRDRISSSGLGNNKSRNATTTTTTNLVIKRSGGTLVSSQVSRLSPGTAVPRGRGESLEWKRCGGSGGGPAMQKRPKLHLHQQQYNNNFISHPYNLTSSSNKNNHHNHTSNNYMQRQLNNSNNHNNNSQTAARSKTPSNNNNRTNRNNNPATSNGSNGANFTALGPLDHKEMVDIWKLLAKGIYATGCPLSVFENEYWIAAFKLIRPDLTLPTTYALSNSLLRDEYLEVRQQMHDRISSSNFVTLQCQSHPGNSLEEEILSFFITTPVPVLYRTVTFNQGSTKDTLSDAISSTIDEIGSTKVLAFISDISSDLKSCWEQLRSKYPGLLTFGCILQGLNSLLDNFMEEPSVKAMCQKGKQIIDKTKSSAALKRRFQEIQRQLKLNPVKGFKFSSKSKWSSVAKSLSLLASQKEAFAELVGCKEGKDAFNLKSDSTSSGSSSGLVVEDEFWKGIVSVTNIIVPLSNWIKLMQVESSPSIGSLPHIFYDLKLAYEKNLSNVPLASIESEESFLKQLTQTKRLCMNELHYAAGLLNPKIKSSGLLTEDEEEEGSEFIHYFCETRGLDAQSSLKDLLDYRKNSGIFSKRSNWELVDELDPISWWNRVAPTSPLSTVAIHLLTIAPPLSTFQPEQAFGTVPSNQPELEKDKIDNLTFLQHHLRHPKSSPLLPLHSLFIPTGEASVTEKEWSPQPDFKLEDQEPMDVTQFLSQNRTSAGIYTDSDEEENGDGKDTNIRSNHSHLRGNHNNPQSILSNLVMKPLSEDEEEEGDDDGICQPILLNNKSGGSKEDDDKVDEVNQKEEAEVDDDDSSSSSSSSDNSSSSTDEEEADERIQIKP